jgi:hypothetical protein
MQATAQSQLQRAELDAVLGSGIFHRAPNLSKFLTYVCERYFEGAGSQIKEYNIAVEALGRPPDFDQKKDSIVRVEAHRLRKRLAEYYANAGSCHPIQIVIPNGQYAPQFIETTHAGTSALEKTVALAAPLELLPLIDSVPPVKLDEPTRPSAPRRYLPIAILAVCVLVALLFLFAVRHFHGRAADASHGEVWSGSAAEPVSGEYRMLAGYHGPPFTDRQGHRWAADAYFKGGRSVAVIPPRAIEGLPDPDLPQTMREGNFRYDVPLRPGTYELHLYFIETDPGRREGDELRSFRVNVNGETKLDLFDALSEAGAPNRLQVRVFKDVGPSPDGKMHIEFIGQSGQPILSGIEILSSLPGRIRPIRIVAHNTPVTDGDGRVWAADEYAFGGHLVVRTTSVSNIRQRNLFEGERFGNFAYRIPVAPGKYRLTLYFAETYFGGALPNSPPFQKGARLFDLFVNGVAVLRSFDIGDVAGTPNRGIVQTFENLEPNAQGLIVLEFHPLRNYACVNAIEIEEVA